ncbi:DEDD exonuclease domain-containing protein [Lawsonella clevelandensis]|uniref:DNA polymerase III PolC-type n=1 Tax=Lawsonella clevelandensis TaxID=1528099 RepID=A0A5E3ZYQ1_9ACTN|nr:DEDD exonuclease domain-containing protein [Lawsonella clevelandensis]MDU7194150.1 DEDD exonuclease domain-containing protein [Lawsonella clevelandensis]VHO01607.1 DNA polymerase III PolC-type [Lawsonella clevelandensis]
MTNERAQLPGASDHLSILSSPTPALWPAHRFSLDGSSTNTTPLCDATFVVIDLETTGMTPGIDAITEIGAVRVTGGVIEKEFATLVNPEQPISPFIEELTGITNQQVRDAPTIDVVFPSLLEFIAGSTLVAHNASFDLSFLRATAQQLDYRWPDNPSLCTVKLARRILDRQEAPSVKLSALAQLFHTQTRPSHRALDDARTTVEVLHGLIERVGTQEVTTLADLSTYRGHHNSAIYAKRSMANTLPHLPGVYIFRDAHNIPLYVGTATDLRRRVMGYFNGSETRRRMSEMVLLADHIDYVECPTPFEAGIRELRLISAHQPPYNRRSRNQEGHWWLIPPRASATHLYSCTRVAPTEISCAVGPFRQRSTAVAVGTLIESDIRQGVAPTEPLTQAEKSASTEIIRELAQGLAAPLIERTQSRLAELATAQHYEQAAFLRDTTAQAVLALSSLHRYQQLYHQEEIIVAEPDGRAGWFFTAIRHGMFAGTLHCLAGEDYRAAVAQLHASAQTILSLPDAPMTSSQEERQLVYRYLGSGHVRLVDVAYPWHENLSSACRYRDWAERATATKK